MDVFRFSVPTGTEVSIFENISIQSIKNTQVTTNECKTPTTSIPFYTYYDYYADCRLIEIYFVQFLAQYDVMALLP